MGKTYIQLSDQQRRDFIRLIYEKGLTIKAASDLVGIPYPNAKAVNMTYLKENRIVKKPSRFRLKKVDRGKEVVRNPILAFRENPFHRQPVE